jgi:hypothetical protein
MPSSASSAFKFPRREAGLYASTPTRSPQPPVSVARSKGEGIEACDRLVEEKLGPLGDCQVQGELGPLATRELARLLLRVQGELPDPAFGQFVVPSRVQPGAILDAK